MPKPNVFITIDTEHSIGGAFADPALKPVGNDKRIYGRINGQEYGIPLIMDIADRYGIPLTFFVEVLNKYYFGEEETREVCEYILGRGHDVQLHLHPNFLNFKDSDTAARQYRDNMSAYDLDAQKALITEGKELLTRYCGRAPTAFRAGNYGADANTLKALKSNGIFMDSSYNAAFPKHSRRLHAEALNDAAEIDGVWELPITNFTENIPLRGERLKPLDLNGVSLAEMKAVIHQALDDRGPRNLTLILHSFSFLKARDVQYRECSVRKYVIERFEGLCRTLAELGDRVRCRSFSDLAAEGMEPVGEGAAQVFPRISAGLSVLRGIEQQYGEVSAR
ncbi:hypothetical protein SAMN05660860_03257 [Geoalkalibacter ferrihydriticus]|uniref:Polysaccharide deacetylase n=2 Tax=Geoalkalibacter ferrihydriticus TaxID=392333 RepID=A0A0C2HET8_9BACT|nr:hypothetical protein [Geoalkalibacter ferrihydriticus]KIH75476.1 hypothetical protein GFER_16085 [Geoalkalibacter ferrihydriticus DSM 17813]SDM84379.1 hypothetical protein SAMN05660860_03257 [Geoalkalibacter ferrihydriticus]